MLRKIAVACLYVLRKNYKRLCVVQCNGVVIVVMAVGLFLGTWFSAEILLESGCMCACKEPYSLMR